ncbi:MULTISPECIES: hypothetical protein [Exiguobacterium]|uniref:hypothetical protein n=1 Tax=Exiguobacterium TaxID=33986 RepID=UPI0025BE0475|nr:MULTISPECIES: hypothetical protein [Exiguobacterium]
MELKTESIQLADCFAVLMRQNDHYVLVSIALDGEWELKRVLQWLDLHEVRLFHPTQDTLILSNVQDVIDAVTFQGYPLVLVEKGTNVLFVGPEYLEEVTDEYEHYHKITNTASAESLEIEDE